MLNLLQNVGGARHPGPRHGDRRDRPRHRPVADRRLAVPSGLLLQLVQDGHSFTYALLLSALLTLAFRLITAG
jgi:hypothetical protein